MRILLTGSTGQVGFELLHGLALLGEVLSPGRAQLDLSAPDSVGVYLDRVRPDLIVNPAAYTAVDQAEQEPSVAFAVNELAPTQMARWCVANEVGLIHYSTDYVYDGQGESPFGEDDHAEPVGVYGRSKLAGDQAIAASGACHLIFRTSWVYGARGKNFLNTMLRLAETSDELRVVDDQIGAPTPARLLADATVALLARHGVRAKNWQTLAGIYHLAPTGSVSWHGFAQQIMQHRAAMTGKKSPAVRAITTAQFPTPAARPANSRLSTDKAVDQLGLRLPDWQSALRLVMQQRLQN